MLKVLWEMGFFGIKVLCFPWIVGGIMLDKWDKGERIVLKDVFWLVIEAMSV